MTTIETVGRTNTATRSMLACGVIAGPLFVATVTAQILTRDGFDLRRHPISLLSVGEHGWIQVATFILAGLLSIIFSIGVSRALPDGSGSRWAPRLFALFGVGLVIGGIFKADPALGFPAGAPEGYPEHITMHGLIHAFAPPLSFLSLIAACLVIAHRGGIAPCGPAHPACRSGVFCAQRAGWFGIQHPVVPGRGSRVRGARLVCPLSATSAQGLIATRRSRRIEECTGHSKSQYGLKSSGSKPAATTHSSNRFPHRNLRHQRLRNRLAE